MTSVDVAAAPIESAVADHDEPTLIRRLLSDRSFVIAASVVGAVVIGAVFAGVLSPYDPLEQNLSNVLRGPSADHWLGTDELGRDVLSRMLFAARVSLKASVLAVAVALVLGFPLGLLIGYRGGRLESVVMRVSDGLMAMPGLIIVIAVIGIIGNGLVPAMAALGLVLTPVVLRLTRGIALGLRNEPYVDSARVLGMRTPRVVGRHLLPHVLPALIVQTSLLLGAALLVEAGLSFIGLGVQPPEAGWGSMLTKGASLFRRQWFVLVPPGVAITATVLAFNVLGDSIRDAMTAAPTTSSLPPTPPRQLATRERSFEPDERHALAVDGLTVAFGSDTQPLVAVDDVGFVVDRGTTLGLVGESGCGKSVTALACMGLLPPTAAVIDGSVHLGSRDVTGLDERAWCSLRGNEISMVFQDPANTFDPTYTVGYQIAESLRIHRDMSKRAAEAAAVDLLDLVGIHDPRRTVRSYPHQFSGGMLQRVAIAAALACEPAVLIADEPTTALDVTVQAEILALLRDLQRELGMAIVLVTHDLGVIAEMCDDVVVMYAGQVVERADVRSIFATPSHPYTRALLAAMPAPEHKGGDLPAIPGRVPPLTAMPSGCRFAARCTDYRPECDIPVELEPVAEGRVARCRFPHLEAST